MLFADDNIAAFAVIALGVVLASSVLAFKTLIIRDYCACAA
jgi:hypothetical protein